VNTKLTSGCYRKACNYLAPFYDPLVRLMGFCIGGEHRFSDTGDTFCSYAVATTHFKSPPIAWCGQDTAIQKDAILRDLGVFDTPDVFFEKFGTNLNGIKALLYQHVFRPRMNHRVERIRQATLDPIRREHWDNRLC
jgi:hypothetical protein